jgi:hypothetical protein
VGKKEKKRKKKSSGGRLSNMRSGFKSFVGTGGSKQKKKESLASKILTYLLLAAAVGVLIYKLTR